MGVAATLSELSEWTLHFILWRLIQVALQSDWLLQKIVHFSSFRCTGVGDSKNSIKSLSCLIFGHLNIGQAISKHDAM